MIQFQPISSGFFRSSKAGVSEKEDGKLQEKYDIFYISSQLQRSVNTTHMYCIQCHWQQYNPATDQSRCFACFKFKVKLKQQEIFFKSLEIAGWDKIQTNAGRSPVFDHHHSDGQVWSNDHPSHTQSFNNHSEVHHSADQTLQTVRTVEWETRVDGEEARARPLSRFR